MVPFSDRAPAITAAVVGHETARIRSGLVGDSGAKDPVDGDVSV